MTGLARADNRLQNGNNAIASTPTRLVKSTGYYQSMLQSKIDDIVREMERLRSETEMADFESDSRRALERKHNDTLNAVQKLEGDLADINLTKEYDRSGTHPDDIKNEASRIIRHSKQMEEEIDQIFFKRKKSEDEALGVEHEFKRLHSAIQSKFHDSSDSNNMDHCKALVKGIDAVIAETKQQEDDIVLMGHKFRMMESNPDNYQYMQEKRRVDDLKNQMALVDDEILLAPMTEDESREHLLGKICGIRLSTKDLEKESSEMEYKLESLQEMQREVRSEKRMKSTGGAASAFERLLKKDAEMSRCLEELPVTKAKLE
mmetsp:Transcript_19820/g.47610  ORF Transcript_19820/g.47610 Transcript_19820/m.47610 type:complete len:318 (+) Transcript_19820:125-1078(+)